MHRLVVEELLVDLNDLHGLETGVDLPEEVALHDQRQRRDEGRRRHKRLVAELGGGRLIEVRRVVDLIAAEYSRIFSRPTTK